MSDWDNPESDPADGEPDGPPEGPTGGPTDGPPEGSVPAPGPVLPAAPAYVPAANPVPPSTAVPPVPPSKWQENAPRILAVFGVIAALVLIIGAIVWISNGDEQIATSSTIPVVSSTDATLPSTTVEETTTTPPTTVAETTTVPETTVPETTLPETTVPPITAPPRPSGDTWSVTSALFPNDPFTLRRVAQVENLAAYDGVIRATPNGIRCVAIVVNGKDGWREWCGNANQPVNFLTIDGIDPWIVEVGAAIGDIALTRQQPSWTLPMNGCTEAVTTLIAAASVVSPAVITGAVCVPGEAFLTNGSVFLQPGPVDGGGALVAGGDEGWDVRNYGTSIGCDDSFDGVDRCALYGVAAELFDAVLPIPPIEALTSTDNIAMSNETGNRSVMGRSRDRPGNHRNDHLRPVERSRWRSPFAVPSSGRRQLCPQSQPVSGRGSCVR